MYAYVGQGPTIQIAQAMRPTRAWTLTIITITSATLDRRAGVALARQESMTKYGSKLHFSKGKMTLANDDPCGCYRFQNLILDFEIKMNIVESKLIF